MTEMKRSGIEVLLAFASNVKVHKEISSSQITRENHRMIEMTESKRSEDEVLSVIVDIN